ncbi:MAG: FGGY-family carbohydrate kinase, partial [Atribacterota bacterium]
VGGGGAASNKWLQIIADIIGENINVSDTTENTALGAAIMAAYGLKMYDSVDLAVKNMCRIKNTFISDEGRLAIYNKFFNEVYKEVYPAIRKHLRYLGSFDVNASGEK